MKVNISKVIITEQLLIKLISQVIQVLIQKLDYYTKILKKLMLKLHDHISKIIILLTKILFIFYQIMKFKAGIFTSLKAKISLLVIVSSYHTAIKRFNC
jgi:uncharacterized protein involved in cysteine biosynthesis